MKRFKLSAVTGAALAIAVLAGCASMTLVSIEQDTVSGPSQVRQGQNINPRDITIYGNYKDGSRKTVSVSAGNISFNRDAVGQQTVRVKVGNYEASFQTEVMALTGIRLDRPPSKIEYMQGESLSLNGLRVMGEWEGMGEAEITVTVDDISGYNRGAAGSQTLTINKSGFSAAFAVTVLESPFDYALNGTWSAGFGSATSVYTFDNGVYEYSYGDPMDKGTYTTEGDQITTVSTHRWGPSWGFPERWYTKDEIKASKSESTMFMTSSASDDSIDLYWKMILETQTMTYSVDGNTLTLTVSGRSSTYTRRR